MTTKSNAAFSPSLKSEYFFQSANNLCLLEKKNINEPMTIIFVAFRHQIHAHKMTKRFCFVGFFFELVSSETKMTNVLHFNWHFSPVFFSRKWRKCFILLFSIEFADFLLTFFFFSLQNRFSNWNSFYQMKKLIIFFSRFLSLQVKITFIPFDKVFLINSSNRLTNEYCAQIIVCIQSF